MSENTHTIPEIPSFLKSARLTGAVAALGKVEGPDRLRAGAGVLARLLEDLEEITTTCWGIRAVLGLEARPDAEIPVESPRLLPRGRAPSHPERARRRQARP